MTTGVVLIILLAYGAAMLWIGRLARTHAGSFQDAIAAPRQTTLLMLAGSAIGGQIGSGFVVGGAEYGAQYGLAGAWYGVGCGLSYFVTAALARFIHTRQLVSLSDYFTQRYRGRAIRLIYSVTGIFSSVALLAGQLLAGRAIFLTLGMPSALGVVLTAVISLLYTNRAGLWGSMAVSSLQSAIIFLGMVAALAAVLLTIGPEALAEELPARSLHLFAQDGEFLFSMAGPIVLASAVNQIAFQSATSAKTARTAQGGYLLAGILLLPIALIPPLLGMFGRTLFPELPAAEVFTQLLLTRLPTVVAAVILAAVVCSVISSCTGAYIAAAANAVHDIYQGMLRPRTDSQACRRWMLRVDLAVCGAGILLALGMNDIIQVLSMGYSLAAVGCLVPFLGGILWRRGSSAGALTAALTGMGAGLADAAGLLSLPYASLTCVLLSGLAYWLVSLVRPDPVTAP